MNNAEKRKLKRNKLKIMKTNFFYKWQEDEAERQREEDKPRNEAVGNRFLYCR